jgi:hypothetical protein
MENETEEHLVGRFFAGILGFTAQAELSSGRGDEEFKEIESETEGGT